MTSPYIATSTTSPAGHSGTGPARGAGRRGRLRRGRPRRRPWTIHG
ncbi:hypothetical protein HBB16_20760 [Pseudonocardia sp. MCCB 268]|nr:hypothetical protein [Pseudonocardia cytotoxica]